MRRIDIALKHKIFVLLLPLLLILGGGANQAPPDQRAMAQRARDATERANEGMRLMKEGQLQEAIREFERAEQLIAGSPNLMYNMACAQALAGQQEEALQSLENAINRGFSDQQHIAADRDLISLRELPQFTRLLDLAAEKARPHPSLLQMPKSYDSNSDRQYDLIIALHGSGGKADSMMKLLANALPNSDYFILAPYGSQRVATGYTWAGRDMQRIVAESNELREKYRIKRRYLLGFSAGAHLGYIFAVAHREAIDGFIPMAGALRMQNIESNQLERVKGLPLYAIQGGNDQVVHPQAAKNAVAIFKKYGAFTKYYEHAGGHTAPKDFSKVLKEALTWLEDNQP